MEYAGYTLTVTAKTLYRMRAMRADELCPIKLAGQRHKRQKKTTLREAKMAKVHVIAKRDFIRSITTTARPLIAISELIWNGFDADSSRVQVNLEHNEMNGIQAVRISDFGYGIQYSRVASLFGDLGESWKKSVTKQNGRALHGKNGKGRFKAFALGERVEWKTTYQENGKRFTYTITGSANAPDDFELTDPVEVPIQTETGTIVCIENLGKDFRSLHSDTTPMELAKLFAAFLMEYPSIQLYFDGVKINPADAQRHKADYNLGDISLSNGRATTVSISVIEWNFQTERIFHLCDASGVALHDLPAGKMKAPGFNFSVYVKSNFFRELDTENQLCLSAMDPDVMSIFDLAKNKVKSHFRRRILEGQSEVIEGWKRDKIYPYEAKENLDPVELAERQVFEILAVNVQSYLPSFESADVKSRRFTFSLLAQAIRQNPESVQLIIGEVLGLKKEAQDELAALLEKTSLSSIISAAKTVANRLDFLNGLENLIFDRETKKKLLERDQLHKILENEAWIFHEEFSLAGSEERLEDVLKKHMTAMGNRADSIDLVDVGDGKGGRIDLMLHKTIQPRTGEYDYLVVELKRPSKKIDADVLTQIEKYAIAVANDERFRGVKAKWTFLAVSNELDDYARRKTRQRNTPIGRVYDDEELNITVWAKDWSDVINDARAKLLFINQQLSYEANRDSSKEYLHKTHSKFIPIVGEEEEADNTQDLETVGDASQ